MTETIGSHDESCEQLFDLREDPDKTKKLVADPGKAETLKLHRNHIADWIRRTGDTFRIHTLDIQARWSGWISVGNADSVEGMRSRRG